MNMRRDNSWTSFGMTPTKWVAAAQDYNLRLGEYNRSRGKITIFKTPRALMEKLADVESKILVRIASNNFVCESFFLFKALIAAYYELSKAVGHGRFLEGAL